MEPRKIGFFEDLWEWSKFIFFLIPVYLLACAAPFIIGIGVVFIFIAAVVWAFRVLF